jgi:hypothetical protein
MPLTPFQSATLRLLAADRSPESFVEGGTVLNAEPDSPRFSKDVDIFHDVETAVAVSAESDALTLTRHGYRIVWVLRQPMIQRADAARGDYLECQACSSSMLFSKALAIRKPSCSAML